MPPKKGEQHFYGFDSTGLEKAAVVSISLKIIELEILQAAKFLDGSQNAKKAFEISVK